MLKVHSLNFAYKENQILKDITFEIDPGEIVCLLGKSGSGKSTLLRCLAELEVGQGRIEFSSKKVEKGKSAIGFVFQDGALFPHMKVGDQIAYGLKGGLKKNREKVMETAKLFEIEHLLNSYPDEISGGEAQRVAIARSLICEPNLLILDEPFSSLDTVLRKRLAVDLRDILKKRGVTALFVTHDQEEAYLLSDRIGVMHQGRLLQYAKANELYHKPNHPEVARLIGKGNWVDAKVEDNKLKCILGAFDVSEYHSEGEEFNLFIRPEWFEYSEEQHLSNVECSAVKYFGSHYQAEFTLKDKKKVHIELKKEPKVRNAHLKIKQFISFKKMLK